MIEFRNVYKNFGKLEVLKGINLKIEKGEVLVLVDSALRPEDVDEVRQRRAADEAKEALLQKRSIEEYHAAQARLARALARLNVKHKYGR